jgi:hypothetical protein
MLACSRQLRRLGYLPLGIVMRDFPSCADLETNPRVVLGRINPIQRDLWALPPEGQLLVKNGVADDCC